MPVFTQGQYDALLSAISTGSKRVKYSDKEVEYRTLSEMLALLDLMGADLGLGAVTGNGRTVAQFESGLCDIYPSGFHPCCP